MSIDFFSVKNKTPTGADLYFYGDIVADQTCKWSFDDKCPSDITQALEDCNGVDTLNIYINSGGGNVFAGIAIYNILKRYKAKKIVHVDSLAASIASVIALCADELVMPKNTFLMIHKASSCAFGNANEMRETADRLEEIEQCIVKVYEENMAEGMDIDTIKKDMEQEKWISAEEAGKYFKNVVVTDSIQAAACISDFSFCNIPDGLIVQNLTIEPCEKSEPEIENLEDLKNDLDFVEAFLYAEGMMIDE